MIPSSPQAIEEQRVVSAKFDQRRNGAGGEFKLNPFLSVGGGSTDEKKRVLTS